ncbi:pentatricopeptide repeat-containing protein At1g10270-like [Aristolochia californica]|uniref:pentatricopeptide repeat-containing protein At1g10270-like n=1 Tax=Aristolochia californica TaxID=171875 RepID=UPI0035D6DB8B
MSFSRFILRSLQHSVTKFSTRPNNSLPPPSFTLCASRSYAFSSAEEAAAERRRRKRRLRIEPPPGTLRDPNAVRPPPDPKASRMPDSTSALTGRRLNLHNRVQSLIRSGDLDSASATARQSVFSNTRPTVFTCNAVTASMFRARRFDDGIAHFQFFFRQAKIIPNVVSYNILINTFCDAGRVDTALDTYRYVSENEQFGPSTVTYRHLIKGLVDANRISEAIDLLREMLNKGHGADSLVYNTLMDGFIKLGNMKKALELFEELKERCLVYDGLVHATLMEAYFQKGMENEAMDSYKDLLGRQFNMNAVTCNTLLVVLMKYGKMNDALPLFDQMLAAHKPLSFIAVNTDSYNLMVNEYFRLRKIEEAIAIFKKTGPKPYTMDIGGYNNIIGKLCAEDGWVEEAEKLFDEMYTKSVTPDVQTFELLIEGYFREGKMDAAIRCFNKMVNPPVETVKPTLSIFGTSVTSREEQGVKASVGFYNKVISGFVERERLQEAQEVLRRMAEKQVKPDLASYDCLIMALCKSGQLDQIRTLLDEMMAKNEVTLSPKLHETVLNAFGKEGWRDVESMLQQKIDNIPSDSSAYVPQFQQVTA